MNRAIYIEICLIKCNRRSRTLYRGYSMVWRWIWVLFFHLWEVVVTCQAHRLQTFAFMNTVNDMKHKIKPIIQSVVHRRRKKVVSWFYEHSYSKTFIGKVPLVNWLINWSLTPYFLQYYISLSMVVTLLLLERSRFETWNIENDIEK